MYARRREAGAHGGVLLPGLSRRRRVLSIPSTAALPVAARDRKLALCARPPNNAEVWCLQGAANAAPRWAARGGRTGWRYTRGRTHVGAGRGRRQVHTPAGSQRGAGRRLIVNPTEACKEPFPRCRRRFLLLLLCRFEGHDLPGWDLRVIVGVQYVADAAVTVHRGTW